jgi:hypothetical protein
LAGAGSAGNCYLPPIICLAVERRRFMVVRNSNL